MTCKARRHPTTRGPSQLAPRWSAGDLDRILGAVERSRVPTNELQSATYAPDDTVQTAGFLRSGGGIGWNYAYLYSPHQRPPEWDSPLGPVTITPIGDKQLLAEHV